MKTFRRWLANKLAGIARWIYPQSEEVMSFWSDRMMDMMLTGKSIVRVQAVKPEEYENVTYPTATDPEMRKASVAALERSMQFTQAVQEQHLLNIAGVGKPKTMEEIAADELGPKRWPTYFQMRGETPPKPRTMEEIGAECLNRAFERDKKG